MIIVERNRLEGRPLAINFSKVARRAAFWYDKLNKSQKMDNPMPATKKFEEVMPNIPGFAQVDFNNVKIENVDKITWKNFIKNLLKAIGIASVFSFLPVCFVMLLDDDVFSWPLFFVFSIPFFILFLAVYYITIQEKVVAEFMRRLARGNGFVYRGRDNTDTIKSPGLNSIGAQKWIEDVVEGVVGGFSIKLFNFHYYPELKAVVDRRFTVCEVIYKANLPRIFLRAKRRNYFENKVKNLFDKETEHVIELEGSFNKYFKLYVPKELEIEVLQIFTPDIMERLIEESKSFDIEIFEDRFYIYAHKLVKVNKELQQLFELAQLIAIKLAPRLERIKFKSIV